MELPRIGMGTFGSDRYDEKTVANAVKFALEAGYRLFDCASVYGNGAEIGEVFARAFASGTVKREDLIVMSKVWNDMHGAGKVTESCLKSIEDLRVGYLDVYFLHWPFPNYHAKGCDVTSRNADSRPFFVEDFMAVWREMESLKIKGYVKEIAMSNMTVAKMKAVLPLCKIKPYAHEMELHPTFSQKELYDLCVREGIKIIGYCPLGSPNRPERDRTAQDIADTESAVIKDIAGKYGCHPAEICLAWAIRKGHTPIPFASKERNILNNFTVGDRIRLTDEEMAAIDGADADNRLIKGQVFLWKGSDDWRDLWDLDGKIADWRFVNDKWIKKEN